MTTTVQSTSTTVFIADSPRLPRSLSHGPEVSVADDARRLLRAQN